MVEFDREVDAITFSGDKTIQQIEEGCEGCPLLTSYRCFGPGELSGKTFAAPVDMSGITEADVVRLANCLEDQTPKT